MLRAVPAAVIALVITFLADHSAFLGAIALGGFALATGAVLIVGSLKNAYPRMPFLVQGSVLAIGGVAALVLSRAGLPVLVVLISVVIGVTGIIELVTGLRARGREAGARDWVFIGGLSALFATAVLLVPIDFVEVISIPDKSVPPLTASVVVVGLLGAYAAIAAVYLVIAGLSLKWAPAASTPVASEAP